MNYETMKEIHHKRTMLDEVIVNAQQRANLWSGGR